jgi:hypothetical protein
LYLGNYYMKENYIIDRETDEPDCFHVSEYRELEVFLIHSKTAKKPSSFGIANVCFPFYLSWKETMRNPEISARVKDFFSFTFGSCAAS